MEPSASLSALTSPVESIDRPDTASKPLRPILIIKDSPYAARVTKKRTVKSTNEIRLHRRPQLIVVHKVFVWLITMALCFVVASLYFKPTRKLIRAESPFEILAPLAPSSSYHKPPSPLIPVPRQFHYQARINHMRAKYGPPRLSVSRGSLREWPTPPPSQFYPTSKQ
ncbi:hypothetical protein HWV62_10016 [Athelia sp. TMB]|nr:hypothetical protein HWV62_10016 [Athelia sp. TMB]